MVANAGSTRGLISYDGASRSGAESGRFSRRERAICQQKVRRATDLSARLGRSEAERTLTMACSPAPLAPITPKASSADTKNADVIDGHYVAKVACQPLHHDRGRCHKRSALHAETVKPAIRGRVEMIRPESASGIGCGRGGQRPLRFPQSGNPRDTPIRQLMCPGVIQLSLGSTNVSDVRHFIAPRRRG
jgi:hypothetical protein